MEDYGLNTEKELYERLKQSLSKYSKEGFSVKLHSLYMYEFKNRKNHNITIYKWNNPIAVIDVKRNYRIIPSIHNPFPVSFDNESLLSRYRVIYSDNNKFFLNDSYKRNADPIEVNYEELLDKIVNPEPVIFGNKERQKIKDIFLETQQEILNDNIELKKFITDKRFETNLKFREPFTCSFEDSKTGISEFENQFFISLLGKFEKSQICRYTTLNTIFSMLNYKSFRMSGLIGMNDKSEVNYVDTYLQGVEVPLIDEHHSRIMALNRRYITSCTTLDKKDDLTMWRLYADDSKGVCLTFDVNTNNTNDHVLIQEVRYADANGKHPELEYLRALQVRISNALGFTFQFRKLGIWKHFFKAFDYSIEKEVRLMVIDDGTIPKIKTDWVMTYTHSIINPIIDFQLNSNVFPIQLREIMLGSKCPEQETNKVQLVEMLRRKKNEIKDNNSDKTKEPINSDITKIKVELSKIKHYR
ncbi:DUF2971 domain-containing protein [Mangrovimonas sp. AS39]|uniref:DUF2971 domain-containing protein n=1 Tax=Mangrovimonas futianensis TaxID=2895523 RepID=UPI001E5FEA93|nr:DUF2971 domain-containing protein [Mangrovimonas futianensis]MCF1192500.1 DUF2971 domain-containing protein [Mangrovimonas futianensis]MCF1196170.1 DUF2971 domain-containing protein [Mangrovimonas futianensis]